MDNHLADIIGMLGTANIVGAYMLLQFNRIDAKGLALNCINLCGAILLLISLLVKRDGEVGFFLSFSYSTIFFSSSFL